MGKDHLMVLSVCPERARPPNRPPGYEQADNMLIVGASKYDCWTVAQDILHQNQPSSQYPDEGFVESDCWVLSCDFDWPENGVVLVDEEDEDYQYDDIFSRIDALSDMVSQDGTYLAHMDGVDATQNCAWLVGDLLNLTYPQEGVDFWEARCEPYVEWRASLYGGRFRNRTAS
jgi:hypothetical protein